jgi:uncharacterized protein (TIGR01244 family)
MKPIFTKLFSNKIIFGLSILAGIIFILAAAGYSKWQQVTPVNANLLTKDIWVSEQLKLESIAQLKKQGFKTIIDLRPDGEAIDQPTAADVKKSAAVNDIAFTYVPVQHGEISNDSVVALDKALSNNPKPVLLYCRSGKRAARTWSLVEASRVGGLDAATIISAVKGSGQSADDLTDAINQRIANRNSATGVAP